MAADPRAKQRELWKRYHQTAHGTSVEGELVQQYLPLVKNAVGRMAMSLPSHVEVDDLYSTGMVGLLDALRHFDCSNGARFETYARIRIRGAVLDELRRMDWVPRSVHNKARKVQNAMQELEQQKGALPTDDELARALCISLAEYREWLDEIKPATFVCLDAAQSPENEDTTTKHEGVADDAQIDPRIETERRELAALITERIQHLPDMQRKVLALYYFEDMRLREIAEAFGLTESRICQIHAQAILAIQAFLKKCEPCTTYI